ncbi:MAG: Unknown protein [uncultured Thiotrichaceae bacterium]|uniref:Lipoprotein n=1 Tax=uncultured Thiotrichaceae bacterium TaxID=298394 RepID=A0A6S6SJW4_9GAMM|nr:MAG: Unknown protein [uncultured Thiotrichaceae bacterium]
MIYRILMVLLATLWLAGCGPVKFDNVQMEQGERPVATKLTEEQKKSISGLKQALLRLSPNVSEQEATILAHDSVVYSMVLANKYKLTYPPLWHNVLVNSKKRPRGLCYHWQRDLMTHFRKKKLQTFDLKEGVAYEKDYWREHNTMVVTAKGQSFDSGVVIDPWRNSGILAWAPVTNDKYPWKLRVWKDQPVKKVSKADERVPAAN